MPVLQHARSGGLLQQTRAGLAATGAVATVLSRELRLRFWLRRATLTATKVCCQSRRERRRECGLVRQCVGAGISKAGRSGSGWCKGGSAFRWTLPRTRGILVPEPLCAPSASLKSHAKGNARGTAEGKESAQYPAMIRWKSGVLTPCHASSSGLLNMPGCHPMLRSLG